MASPGRRETGAREPPHVSKSRRSRWVCQQPTACDVNRTGPGRPNGRAEPDRQTSMALAESPDAISTLRGLARSATGITTVNTPFS